MKFSADYRALALDALRGRWKTAVLAGLVASVLGANIVSSSDRVISNMSQNANGDTPGFAGLFSTGSGGALALAAADRVYMLENAVYSVISPEGCASILWKDSGRVADAAQCLHITAADMVDLHVAEGIIPENFADFQQMCAAMTVQLTMDLDELCALTPEELLEQRYRRYRRIGVYEENGSIVRFTEH